MRFSRSFLSVGRQRTGKPSLQTLISHSLMFIAGMSICRLSNHVSDSVSYVQEIAANSVADFWNAGDENPVTSTPPSLIKKAEGHDANGTITWKLIDWENPISEEEEAKFKCHMTQFVPLQPMIPELQTAICVHTFNDIISNVLRRNKRWDDCNILPKLWNSRKKDDGRSDGDSYYVEVGANIGSCVLEMLLSTNASIIAFEPHPMNLYNLKKSVSKLDKSYQDRLKLFPIGLGEAAGQSTIYSANNNMGNSVVGRIIKDDDIPGQKFTEELQFTINIERLDSILNNATSMNIRLMKMDAQGFECNVLSGMGAGIAKKIGIIKTEFATRFLRPLNCMDIVKRIKDYGFDVYREYRNGQFHYRLGDAPPGKQHIELYALNKNSTGLQAR